MGKSLLTSKTVGFNVISGLVSVGTALVNSEYVAQHPEVVAIVSAVVCVGNVLLRLITNKPITGVVKSK